MCLYILMLLQKSILGLQVSTETIIFRQKSWETHFELIFSYFQPDHVTCTLKNPNIAFFRMQVVFILRFPALTCFALHVTCICRILFLMLLHSMLLVPVGTLYLLAPCRDLLLLYSHYMWLVPLWNSSSIACSWCLEKSLSAVFALHMILTLRKFFFFCSMHEGSTTQNPFSVIFILHVACT